MSKRAMRNTSSPEGSPVISRRQLSTPTPKSKAAKACVGTTLEGQLEAMGKPTSGRTEAEWQKFLSLKKRAEGMEGSKKEKMITKMEGIFPEWTEGWAGKERERKKERERRTSRRPSRQPTSRPRAPVSRRSATTSPRPHPWSPASACSAS